MHEELKQRQSAMWDSGPFDKIAPTIADVHEGLVERLAPGHGEGWLDVATGTGAVALVAARAGAEVTGVDFAPALIATARRLAEAEGLAVRFDVGDAEKLPYPDAAFDVVSSSFGCIFAPDHEAAAGELARVCASGGRLGLACWRPEGQVIELFELLARFQPPPPPGVGRPLDWGLPEHVSELLGEAFELELHEADTPIVSESGEAVWELFSTSFGPVKTLAESLDPDRSEELHRAFVELHESYRVNGELRRSRPYLVVLGTRR